MVEYLPSKQATWVRFPSPALGPRGRSEAKPPDSPSDGGRIRRTAAVAQSVERVLGKDEVLGSNPSGSSWVPTQSRAVTALEPAFGPRPPGYAARPENPLT